MRNLLLSVALFGACGYALAAQAFWTGQQRQVQTVTYQIAWECEYNYNGQKFWRIFKFSCPSSVEVQ